MLLNLSNYGEAALDVPAPPVLYTNVTTIGIDVQETYGDTTDGLPAEGDLVRLAYAIPEGTRGGIIGAALAGVNFRTVDVVGGDLVVYSTWFPAVALADMLAGEVSLPATSITWRFSNGTEYTESFGAQTVATEAIASSYDADVSLQWRDATRTTTRGPGEGEVGDLIDYTFEMTNTGNVTIHHADLKRVSPEILPIQSVTTDGLGLAPGDTLSSSALTPDFFTSDDARFGPYVIE